MAVDYYFEEGGSYIRDYEDGRVQLVFVQMIQNPGQERSMDLAAWVRGTLGKVYERQEAPLRILVDLGKVHQITMTGPVRRAYVSMAHGPMLKSIAIVGDAFSYSKLLQLILNISRVKKKIKFHFDYGEAKKTLSWQ